MNPLLPIIAVLLIVIIGLIYCAMYLLDARERLLIGVATKIERRLTCQPKHQSL